MAQEDVYFQFPISVLRLGKSIDVVSEDEAKSRLQVIVNFCLVDFAERNESKVGLDHFYSVATDYLKRHPSLRDSNTITHEDVRVLFSADRLDVLFGAFGSKTSSLCRKDFETISKMNSGNQQVRLRRDIFWSVETGEMSWREWSILCGVYAMLGSRPMVKLSYATLNALALGYNGRQTIPFNDFTNHRLTDRKTQTTVDRLKSRGFFSKASPNFRHNWYSMKSQEELEYMLANKESKKVVKANETKAAEQTKRIRDMIAKMVEDEQKAKSRSAPADVARK